MENSYINQSDIHKCFISFKMQDEAYKEEIQTRLGKDCYIDKSLDEKIDSENPEIVMRKIREDYLSDSTVTIMLIGNYSAENTKDEDQYYIKHEIQASLYNGNGGNSRNGILGVVLPDMYEKIYIRNEFCLKCNCFHSILCLNDDTTIKEFYYNYHLPNHALNCSWNESERYCVLVKYEDFIHNPKPYIQQAYDKRFVKSLTDQITVRPK